MKIVRKLVVAVVAALLVDGMSAVPTRAHTVDHVTGPASSRVAAPNGIDYGSTGAGNPTTGDCTRFVDPGGSISSAINASRSGDVVCVRAGDYSSQLVALNRSGVTVRSNGIARIKGAAITGDGSGLDGFTVVGGGYGDPRSGVRFAGSGIKVVNNLVTGGNLEYGISCDKGKCDNGLVAHNSVTGIESIGLFIDSGTGTVVEYNNIYDLHRDKTSYDVDGVRFWGRHIFRYNYVHDINEFESNGNPHTDCFQTYNNGTESSGTLIENNYCLRVSRQCLIAQNNSAGSYQIRNITFRNNVCETYDSQGINLGSMSGVVIENNLVLSGFRYQIINLEVMSAGLANANTTVRNNILIRAKTGAATYRRNGASTNEHFTNNLERVDTGIAGRAGAFNNSHGPYPAVRSADFTEYRAYAGRLPVVDQGIAGNSATTDIDAKARILGSRIDLGPFEIN